MERSIDQLTTLPVDLIFQLLTYLSFQDVVNVSELNSKLYSYCSDPQYNIRWKTMIDNTFSSVVYNYEDKLKKIWSKLHIVDGSYNYLVYIKLINLLDPLSQLMIYYQQANFKSFNDKKFNREERFLTMFLLNKPEEMKKYNPYLDNSPYYLLLQGNIQYIDELNTILYKFATNGNMKGVKYILEQGADVHAYDDIALRYASEEGHSEVIKYLVEQGADIHAENDYSLRLASRRRHLDVVKYLVEKGANIHAENDMALRYVSERGDIELVIYLVEQGANIHALNNYALRAASEKGHLDVVIYLVEQGADIHARDDQALILASQNRKLNVVEYLVEQGANIHAGDDDALKRASLNGHIEVVRFLVEHRAKYLTE